MCFSLRAMLFVNILLVPSNKGCIGSALETGAEEGYPCCAVAQAQVASKTRVDQGLHTINTSPPSKGNTSCNKQPKA